jgi:tetratricopeptide (TPR) repeat protein
MKACLAAVLVLFAGFAAAQNADLNVLKTRYEAAKKAYLAKPKDKAKKDAYVKATVVYGHESMVSPKLGAKVKYRQALRLYREALKLDPKNPVAKQESELIVSIYKQMGRPVPQ